MQEGKTVDYRQRVLDTRLGPELEIEAALQGPEQELDFSAELSIQAEFLFGPCLGEWVWEMVQYPYGTEKFELTLK